MMRYVYDESTKVYGCRIKYHDRNSILNKRGRRRCVNLDIVRQVLSQSTT